MITVNNATKFSNKKQSNDVELKGLSTDIKPTKVDGNTIDVNSLFFELDTGRVYYYDGEIWKEVGV